MRTFKSLSTKEKLEYIGIMAIYPLILLFEQMGKSVKFLNTRKRQITASVLTVCMLLTMIPVMSLTAFAATTAGAFAITDGVEGTEYTYADGVLTVLDGAELTIANTEPNTATSDRIEVASGANANITLAGVNIDVSGTNNTAAFKIADNSTGNVTITLADGTTNTLKSGQACAGLQKNGDTTTGKLTITGTGTLNATSGAWGAGIGGGDYGAGSNITISGGTVTAAGGDQGAGIGGGYDGAGSNITISGGIVTATGGSYSAGIGGGRCRTGSNITISGGTVTATGGWCAAGIGGSYGGTGSNIEISGGTVTAGGGDEGAGIGGGRSGTGSNITISGGSVTATGGSGAAGIGGGYWAAGSNIEISDGTVNATGGARAAGIGGGEGNAGSNITISGGTVTATSAERGAGIGGGQGGTDSDIIISGGSVTATGGDYGAGIGGGYNGAGSNIIISGGSVKATAGTDANTIGGGYGQSAVTPTDGNENNVYLLTGPANGQATVTIDGKEYTTIDGNYYVYLPSGYHTVTVGETSATYYIADDGTVKNAVKYLDENGVEQGCFDFTVITSSDTTLGANDEQEHWYVVDSDVTISDRITVAGTVNLILCDGHKLNAGGGITVNEGNALTIYSQSGGTGALIADASSSSSAGIGGAYSASQAGVNCGSVSIYGGVVTAKGGYSSAGIGGSYNSYVSWEGGWTYYGSGGTITIGGNSIVRATGGEYASSIGGGRGGAAGTITYNQGVIFSDTVGNVYGSVSLPDGMEIKNGETLIILDGTTLTVPAGVTFTNNGKLYRDFGSTFTRNGIYTDNGTTYYEVENASGYPIATGGLKISGQFLVSYNDTYYTTATDTVTIESESTNLSFVSLTYLTEENEMTKTGLSSSTTITLAGEPIRLTALGNTTVVDYFDPLDKTTKTYTGAYALVTSDTIKWGADGVSWYVVDGAVEIENRITVSGTVNLVLKDGASLNAKKGITVANENAIIIWAQSDSDGMGSLIADGGHGQHAAIGGYGSNGFMGPEANAGYITINGGKITCGTDVPDSVWWDTEVTRVGIGGGNYGGFNAITINGGEINLSGKHAGLGGSASDNGAAKAGTITITGGKVTAVGHQSGAGIGCMNGANAGTILITGGVVTATGDSETAGDIGGSSGSVTINGDCVVNATTYGIGGSGATVTKEKGIIFEKQNGKVYGNVTVLDNLEIAADSTLIVPKDASLTIPNDIILTNKGTIIACGTVVGNVKENAVQIHNYGQPIYEWNQNNTVCTATHTCTVDGCGAVETENATIDTEITQQQSCTDDELTKYKANFTISTFATQIKDNVKTKDALGHTSTGDNVATYTKKAVCDRCGSEYGEKVPVFELKDSVSTVIDTVYENTMNVNLSDFITVLDENCIASYSIEGNLPQGVTLSNGKLIGEYDAGATRTVRIKVSAENYVSFTFELTFAYNAPTYTVTIPESVTVTNGEGIFTVKAENVVLGDTKKLSVTIQDTDNEAGMYLTSANDKISYTLSTDSETVGMGGVIFSLNGQGLTATSDSAAVKVAIADTPKYAEEYKGTITFTIAVEDK